MLLEFASFNTELFAQAVPHVDGNYLLLLASRVLHITSAIVLVGGLFYLRTVVAPRVAVGDAAAESWFGNQRGAWAKWVGITTLLLIATGLFNFITTVKTYHIATSYHMLVLLKILIALLVFFLAAILAGRSALAARFRAKMRFWLTVCLAASLAVVVIGSVMRTYDREPKSTTGPTLIAPSN